MCIRDRNGAGQLSGTGTVGAVNVSSGLLSPGDGGTGILNIGGPLTLNASATLPVSLNSTNPGSGHDQLVVSNGNVSLGSAYLNLSVPSNITDVVGMNYTVIKVVAPSNSVSGEFAEMPEGLEVDAPPLRFRITYAGGDGNDVVLTIIGAVPSGRQLGSFN